MAPKTARGTQASGQSGRLSMSQGTSASPELTIEHPVPITLPIEDGDTIMRLRPNIKHFIDPENPPKLNYDPDPDSLFIPIPPSQAELTAANWSPRNRFRLKQNESIGFKNTKGESCTVCPTDTNEFVEIVPQSIAIRRPDPRTRTGSQNDPDEQNGSFLHVVPLLNDPRVTLDGPMPGWPYTHAIDFDEPLTWVGRKVQRQERPIDTDRYLDTPSIGTMADAPLSVVTKAATQKNSKLFATRAAAMSYRATTRSSAKQFTKDSQE